MIILIIELDNIQDCSKQFQKYFNERKFIYILLQKCFVKNNNYITNTDYLAKGNDRKVNSLVLTYHITLPLRAIKITIKSFNVAVSIK